MIWHSDLLQLQKSKKPSITSQMKGDYSGFLFSRQTLRTIPSSLSTPLPHRDKEKQRNGEKKVLINLRLGEQNRCFNKGLTLPLVDSSSVNRCIPAWHPGMREGPVKAVYIRNKVSWIDKLRIWLSDIPVKIHNTVKTTNVRKNSKSLVFTYTEQLRARDGSKSRMKKTIFVHRVSLLLTRRYSIRIEDKRAQTRQRKSRNWYFSFLELGQKSSLQLD